MSPQQQATDTAQRRVALKRPFIFLAVFSLLFVAMYAGYFQVPDSVLRDFVHHNAICQVGATTINWIAPAEHALAAENTIRSPRAHLEIVRGCDGAGAMFLLVSAILAFPVSWRSKLTGLVLGVSLAYLINQTRIVGLYFIAADSPELFTLLHTFYLPTFTVIIYAILFGVWALLASKPACTAGS